MRTTVDLPPAVHRRAAALAAERHSSLSHVLSDLVVRGLSQLDGPVDLVVNEKSGLPVLHLGRKVTSAEVADLVDEEAPADQ